jgi:hypothetical protein
MFRKSIIALAAAATLGAVALAPSSASAYWGGHHFGGFRVGGFHRVWAPRLAYHPHFFAVRHRFFVARHPFFVRRHFAFIDAPILLDGGCWRVHRVWTPWGLRWHRVWVCG